MDSALPSWIDCTYLAAALQGGEDQEPPVTVTKFSATPAVAPGENYLSRLYRVKVEYKVEREEKSTSLIVKVPFTKGIVTEIADFYKKEASVYSHLLPKLNSLCNCEFGPKFIHCSEDNSLFLEDLKEQGYRLCDRYKQLDFSHCERVLTSLAIFHAASVACKHEQPDLIDLVGLESMYFENEKYDYGKKLWLKKAVKTVAELELGKPVEELLLRHSETVADSAYRLCKPKLNGLNVLNHGDLWINNVLFKYSTSGQIDDLRFIDYQITRYTTPVLDLINFMWTSANEEVRECRLPELCEIYRRTLNSTLESLGCEERLTERELQDDFRGAIDWAFIVICSTFPFTVCGTEDVINVEESEFGDVKENSMGEKYLKLFKGKHFRALLPNTMKHFMEWMTHLN